MKLNDIKIGMWIVSINDKNNKNRFTTIDLRKVIGGNQTTRYCKSLIFAENSNKYVLFQNKDEVYGAKDFGLHQSVNDIVEDEKQIIIIAVFGVNYDI